LKKIVFSLIALLVCVGLVGSAFAYFSDVETSTGNTFTAGTLNMEISDNDEGPVNTPVSASFASPAGLAPGDEWTTDPVAFDNVGTIDIRYIFGRFCELVETDGTPIEFGATTSNIADQIILVSYLERAEGSSQWYEEVFDETNANAYLGVWGLANDGSISLKDLVLANPPGDSAKTCLWFFDGGNDPTNPPLPVGGTAKIKFKFKLLESANNNYQGDTVTFRVDFVGSQVQADLDAAITEAVGVLFP